MVWLHIAAMSPPCHHRVTTVSPPYHHRVTTVSPPCHQESLYSLRTVLQGGPNIEQQIHKSMHKAMTHKKQKTTVHECQGNSHGRYLKKKQTTTLGECLFFTVMEETTKKTNNNPGQASGKQSWKRPQPWASLRETVMGEVYKKQTTTLGKPQGNSHGRDHNPGRASEKQSWGRSTKNKQQPREGIRETAISDKLEYIITTWYASFSI